MAISLCTILEDFQSSPSIIPLCPPHSRSIFPTLADTNLTYMCTDPSFRRWSKHMRAASHDASGESPSSTDAPSASASHANGRTRYPQKRKSAARSDNAASITSAYALPPQYSGPNSRPTSLTSWWRPLYVRPRRQWRSIRLCYRLACSSAAASLPPKREKRATSSLTEGNPRRLTDRTHASDDP